MIKVTFLFLSFFASTTLLAQTTDKINPSIEMQINSEESAAQQHTAALKTAVIAKDLETGEATLAGDLPEAILRLYDLQEVTFTGISIYKHVPLELARIKNPIKTV